MLSHVKRAVFVSASILVMAAPGLAQPFPAATIVGSRPGGFIVRVGNDTMVILNTQMVDEINRLRIEHQASTAENARLHDIITAYATADTVTEKLRAITEEYVSSLQQAVVDWRELAEDYKRIKTGATFLSLEGGIGFSGDTKPAMILGVGLGRFRLFGLIQESNLGGFAGVHVPVF